MKYRKSAWMVVNLRGGNPSYKGAGGDATPKIFRTKKLAQAYAGALEDVVKIVLEYDWEWLPR